MSGSRDRSPWVKTLVGVGLFAAALGAVFLVGRWIWMERSKARWSEHLEQTVTWYEEHVGSVDLESYRLPAVPDEENAGQQLLALLEDFPLSDEEQSEVRRFTDRSFDLYRVAEEAEADNGWTDPEREELRELLTRSDAFLRRLDEWAAHSSSSFALVAGEDLPDDLI
ncbi:MAG: hypothetical protein AAGA81_01720, partial [Acidobacteriota bacterium]